MRSVQTRTRIAIPAVLLLFGVSAAQGQSRAATTDSASTLPAPAQPASSPITGSVTATTPSQASVRTEDATLELVPAQEKKRSRVLWLLIGAVIVLGVIVATSM